MLLWIEHIVLATGAAQTKKCTRLATGSGHHASLAITLEASAAEALFLAASCSRGTDLLVYNGVAARVFAARGDNRKHTIQRSVRLRITGGCIPSRHCSFNARCCCSVSRGHPALSYLRLLGFFGRCGRSLLLLLLKDGLRQVLLPSAAQSPLLGRLFSSRLEKL